MNYYHRPRYLLLTSALIVTQASELYAQTAPELLETLVVTGNQSSDSFLSRQVTVKTAQDFKVGARFDPAELLHTIPGVQVDSRTNYAQDTRIVMRGFGARSAFGVRGIDLQVDGIPLSTPDGQGQLASVMLDNIGSVQVLRGPIAALYGNGAGGVIALQTAVPDASNISAGVIAGDPGLTRQTLNGEWRNNNLAMRVQIANSGIDGERAHSRAERKQAALQLFYTTENDLEVIIKHDDNDDPLLQDPLGLTPEQWRSDPAQVHPAADIYNTRKTIAHQQSSITLRNKTGATLWQTGLWQGERAITQYLGFGGEGTSGSGGVVDLARDFAGGNGTLTRNFTLLSMPADVSIGIELAQTEDRRRGFVNEKGSQGDMRRNELDRVDSRDIHTLLRLAPTAELSLYSGARQSKLEMEVDDYWVIPGNADDSGARDYRENAYAFGANYQFADDWDLTASRGRGYETPTLTEMAYSSSVDKTNNENGFNFALDVAINYQTEFGLHYRPTTQSEIVLTYFSIDSQNEIVVDLSKDGRTSYRNAAATEREGIELFSRYHLNESLRVQLSVQSLDALYSAGEWRGNYLPGVARSQNQLDVQWLPFANDMVQLGLGMQQRSRIYSADNNQVYAPDFYTIDLSARGSYIIQSLQLDWWLKLANVTDETYVGSVIVNQSNGRAFEPALGRNMSAGVKLIHHFR